MQERDLAKDTVGILAIIPGNVNRRGSLRGTRLKPVSVYPFPQKEVFQNFMLQIADDSAVQYA